MLSSKVESVRAALGELAGQVGQEQWQVISACRRVLAGVQESAEELENRLVPGASEQQPQAATA